MDGDFDERALRDATGAYPTGVTVVTVDTPTGPLGITVNSFSSLSLDPPLVLWSPARRSRRFNAFANAERFCVHILGEGQRALAQGFAQSGDAPFAEFEWGRCGDGAPEFANCAAVLRCLRHATFPGGDHMIVVGRVSGLHHDATRRPLVFHRGDYPSLV